MKELLTNHYIQIMAIFIIIASISIYRIIKLVKSCDNDKEDIQEGV